MPPVTSRKDLVAVALPGNTGKYPVGYVPFKKPMLTKPGFFKLFQHLCFRLLGRRLKSKKENSAGPQDTLDLAEPRCRVRPHLHRIECHSLVLAVVVDGEVCGDSEPKIDLARIDCSSVAAARLLEHDLRGIDARNACVRDLPPGSQKAAI